MKKDKLYLVVLIITVLLISPAVLEASPVLDSIHYVASGGGLDIHALKLELNYQLDKINDFNTLFYYDGEEIEMEGSWMINFLQKYNYRANLEIALASGQGSSFYKAIGLSGTGNYLAQNQYFWEAKYLFDSSQQDWIYHAGVALPITEASRLTLGLGNTYWYQHDLLLDIGIKVDL